MMFAKHKAKPVVMNRLKPPGTPVRVCVKAASPEPANSDEDYAGETCFVCSNIILEANTVREGEPALLCEGCHKRWAHTTCRCVGVSDVLYEDIQTCESPWLCKECSNKAAQAVQNLPLLHKDVQSLKAENTGLKEEISELRALVASLHSALSSVESRLMSVSASIDLLQSVPTPAEETSGDNIQPEPTSSHQPSYSDAVRRSMNNGQRDQAHRGRRDPPSRSKRQVDRQARPPTTQCQDNTPNPPATGTTSHGGQKKIPVEGKRRIWGTLKACSHTTVKRALDQLVPELKDKFQVKRRYKKLRGNKIRWWHVVSGAEQDLEDLQKAWEPVQIQTSWKLEDANENFLGEMKSPATPT